jgi:hypothetical protein
MHLLNSIKPNLKEYAMISMWMFFALVTAQLNENTITN